MLYVQIAVESEAFQVANAQTVRYGDGNHWVAKVMSGAGRCSNAFFGSDPINGVVKHCELAKVGGPVSVPPDPTLDPAPVPAPVPVVADGDGPPAAPVGAPARPLFDASLIPTPSLGYAEERLSPTDQIAAASDIGAFRTSCDYSHMSSDDPIVYPGQPGAGHLHTFFGNTLTNAFTTPESLRTTGNSTCRGGIVNRSAYWVPTMIDTADGRPLRPTVGSFYYKTGYEIAAELMQPMPIGLRMIAGDSKGSVPYNGPYSYDCFGAYGAVRLPTSSGCPADTTDLEMTVTFPQCWDGVNLDSPDHKSHMSYALDQDGDPPYAKHCPATHPVVLPVIQINVWYAVDATGTSTWRLSSDTYDATTPGGYSAHADWFNGWQKAVSDVWAASCDVARKDCLSHLLGDGRQMY